MNVNNFSGKVSFIWSVADLLRGPYRPNQYKDVMLPMTVLRRLDCVLEPTKDKVLAKQKALSGGKVKNLDPILCRVTGVPFYNTSRYSFEKLKGDPDNIARNLTHYIKSFSSRAREIIENFAFEEHIGKLDKADCLYLLVSRFCDIDLHPQEISNLEMGYIFEEQKRIVGYLDSIWQKLNKMTDKVQQSIQVLKEYRSALISAAVTGKIDVRRGVA
jgi:type I restriction enzyme M protein